MAGARGEGMCGPPVDSTATQPARIQRSEYVMLGCFALIGSMKECARSSPAFSGSAFSAPNRIVAPPRLQLLEPPVLVLAL